ncbi:MAG: PKD domain-containing protein, partial [Proteobacteria bacterium]|nr:PKD domain-containing protein [Pseudomonadota bacterium]
LTDFSAKHNVPDAGNLQAGIPAPAATPANGDEPLMAHADPAPDDNPPIAQADAQADETKLADAAQNADEPAPAPLANDIPQAPALDAPPRQQPIASDDPLAPVADAGRPAEEIKVKENVTFTARASKPNANGKPIATYEWDFGDGNTAKGRDVKHAYKQPGLYTATLTVTDEAGRRAQATRTVDVSRPENKIRFARRKLYERSNAASAQPLAQGTFTKAFSGARAYLDAKGTITSTPGAICKLTLSLQGPGCVANQTKQLDNGGEGEISVKTACKGTPGEFTWSVVGTHEGGGSCAWIDFAIDGYEG